ncbi:thioesterase domain-containing protein [Propioniciclava flava]
MSDIDRQVRSLDGVSDCAIAVHKDRLLAFFVGEGSAQRLQAELTSRVPSYQLPSVYKVEELLMTDHHKLDVQGMLDVLARERPSLDSTTPDVERMCSLWSEVLGVPAGPDSDLYDLGGHSLLVLKLVDKVQAEFGTAITLEDVLQQTTPRLLCRRLRTVDPAVCNAPGGQNVAEPLDQTLVWLRRLDGHPTFYCVHPFGGDALSYLHLVRSLDPDWSVAVLVDPALGGGPLSDSIDELAAGYLKTIERLGDEAPSLLGGWSMGGIIAMEMAHQLAGHGTPPSLVALLDAPTPDRVASHGPEVEEGSALLAAVRRFEEMSGRELLLIDSDAFLTLAPAERRDAAEAAVLKSELVPKSIRREGLARRLDVLAHHERLVWAYRPKEVSAHVLQIRAVGDSEVPDAFGWERYCIGDLQIKEVRASHLGMLSSETAPVVAALLAEALRDASWQKETY